MIRVQDVLDLHASTVALWHHQEIHNPYHGFLQVVCEQHKIQLPLVARRGYRPQPQRQRQAGSPRSSVRSTSITSMRNDQIERLDTFFIEWLWRGGNAAKRARLNTETPGSSVDRLSILSLRMYHLQEQLSARTCCGWAGSASTRARAMVAGGRAGMAMAVNTDRHRRRGTGLGGC